MSEKQMILQYNTAVMWCIKYIKHGVFFCLSETFNERMKNPTSASSVWRNSENIFYILAVA